MGTDVPDGEKGYTTGPYELVPKQKKEQCQSLCSSRTWCASVV